MTIELTIQYTNAEYKSAVEDYLDFKPQKRRSFWFPLIAWLITTGLLSYFDVLFTWWGLSIFLALTIYVVPCLFPKTFMPNIALLSAKMKKLKETYHFKIDDKFIERRSEQGTITLEWDELESVNVCTHNVIFNLGLGVIPIPLSRLTKSQLEQIQRYAKATN